MDFTNTWEIQAELVDSVLDVVRKEAESCDCLQVLVFLLSYFTLDHL